tara:strand:- start:106 stop:552 length:447 start_codon:yes stop_codon:yes gene_type:complete
MSNIVDKVFDNSEDGKPNYAIDLVDGTRLYYRGKVMNPMPQSGDAINFTVINVKTSKGGNPYTNVKDVSIADNHTLDDDLPNNNYQPQQQTRPMPISNGMNKNDTQRMDIFVTGVVGRSMGSGHFSVEDISDLTKNAVRAFNDNLKNI